MRDLMASLTRLVLVRLRRDERGVVGVIVAMLLGAGVLTGMAALVLDIGQIYQERIELQNGADAAALGVAKSCALGACTAGVSSQRPTVTPPTSPAERRESRSSAAQVVWSLPSQHGEHHRLPAAAVGRHQLRGRLHRNANCQRLHAASAGFRDRRC